MKHLFHIFLFMCCAFTFIACTKKPVQVEETALLEVEGKFLYLEDLQHVIPPNANKKDSAEYAEKYIRQWVTNVLMYENAKRNVTNQQEIDDLVEDYRKSLTIHQYQRLMIEQKAPKEVTEEQINAFYKEFGDQLLLKENVIRGLLLIVPINAPKIANVRSWVQSANTKSIESIEKYSIQNAISYDFFAEKWTPLSEVLKKIPIQISDPKSFIANNRFYEVKDSSQHYLLRISSFKTAGQIEPLEMARERISNILLNKYKSEFIQQFESDLYKDAIEKEKVVFYNN